ncbi:MAG: dihydrofolate reductase family protein [Myxococcaceae bacterium]|nr:dihydrofolate reductase family protein [Myxococcaceae bacterium]
MRKIVFHIGMSLDGYFEGPNREIDWHCVDDELHRYMNAVVRSYGGMLTGRITHQLMVDYWPTADADPNAEPTIREFAAIWRDMPKIVFSKTWSDTRWNTTIRREVDPEEIRALKAQPGGDLVVGGPNLTETFQRHDLVDDLRIFVHPVLLGRGRPAFGGNFPMKLKLLDTRRFGNGVVELHYTRVR